MAKALKFSAVFGTTSSYNLKEILPNGWPSAETSKNTLDMVVIDQLELELSVREERKKETKKKVELMAYLKRIGFRRWKEFLLKGDRQKNCVEEL